MGSVGSSVINRRRCQGISATAAQILIILFVYLYGSKLLLYPVNSIHMCFSSIVSVITHYSDAVYLTSSSA